MSRLSPPTHPNVLAIRNGLTAVWLALLFSGTPLSTHAQPAAAPPSQAASLPWSEGEVRKVDTTAGKLTLRHGEIRNLDMPPMTMVFTMADPAQLDGLQPGQRVRVQVVHDKGVYRVLRLEALGL